MPSSPRRGRYLKTPSGPLAADAVTDALRFFAPPPRLTVSEWADRERRLSAEASAEPGRWDTGRAEYQRGIMDAICDPAVEEVVAMTSAQVGKTEVLNNVIGFHIAHDPAPILLLQPTLEMAQAFSKDRLAPMLRDTPALRGLVKDARSRDSGNTLLHKTFPGGHITMAGANSPASLASRPIRIVLADEVDRYPASAGTEGDPVSLARKRSTTFWNRKIVLTSTPTVKGASRIEAAFEESDQRRFHVPCPECSEHQVLRWAQVQWPEGRPEEAVYVCEHCGAVWDDATRWQAIRKGEWRATAPFRGTAGFHLNEIYSPWVRLGEMATRFLEAKKWPETLRAWVNTSLGETWEDSGETIDEAGLMERRETWGERLPPDVAVLTAGVDVQDDRLEVELVGWGRDEESWSIDHRILWGDPSGPAVWQDLDEYLARSWEHSRPIAPLGIRAACVDTGGHHTLAAYNFCRPRQGRRIWAVKGKGGPGVPIWPRRPSRNNKGKVPLFLVGVDAAKEAIYARLRLTEPGPGTMHFPAERDPEWFRQLTAETCVVRYSKGRPVREWQKRSGRRNEALDLRVYAMAALHGLIAMGLRLNAEVDALRNAPLPNERPAGAPVQAPVTANKPRPIRSRWMAR